jgi:CysZ protein
MGQLHRPGFFAGFGEGMSAPFEGFSFLNKNPALWRYAIIPILINFAITLLILAGAVIGGYYLITWMHAHPYFAGWWGWIKLIFADIAAVALLLAGVVGCYLLLGGLLTSMFNERLAKRVELALGTPPQQLVEASIMYQVVDALYDFAVIIGAAAASLLIWCLPVIGTLAALAFNWYVNAWVFGFDYLDIPLTLRSLPLGEKKAFARRHRGHVLGLGFMVTIFNMIPLIGSVFLTTAAVGAVILHKRLRTREASHVAQAVIQPVIKPMQRPQ